jgi:hypothetical protein
LLLSPHFPSSLFLPSSSPYFWYLSFNYANKIYISNPLLYHTRTLMPFIYNAISYIDNATNDILLHVKIFFGIELVNLILLSYTTRPVVRNDTST